ncbi:class Ib ribonucleoside-diphosphate reductase assembly flavoprotein NrdI [Naumannella cuiyingiana]|uniref:Protein NrdI n=1 Tax=Naumannella cuiyingiana TaxID=1347891 RepID=A0A7Z0ILQ5_9ACTN|nr:class Ib ribonucleoside-diphosphate reductase assembly flavoprotein NrdI [Naumannella cuiyingiana]NYI71838.1 protein involved in ribonucleotide reduction [Naumannella cuiyingiana]
MPNAMLATAADAGNADGSDLLDTNERLIYFSSSSGNTHRFVEKLGLPATRLPLAGQQVRAGSPFVLVVPTYGADGKGHVPPKVVRFLNDPANRARLTGVIGAGNTNFHDTYGVAADIIAAKCGVPVLYKFELMGTPEDVTRVREGLEELWRRQSKS